MRNSRAHPKKEVYFKMSETGDKRQLPRVDIRQLTHVDIRQLSSIILNEEGKYESIKEGAEGTNYSGVIRDISWGGVRATLSQELKVGAFIDLEIPKTGELDPTVIKCEVTRSICKNDSDDPFISDLMRDERYYEVGLRFKNHNLDYVKRYIKLTQEN